MLPRFFRTHVERVSEFGALRVVEDTVNRAHVLIHGDTFHGWQFRDPARLDEPTAYYASPSPISELFHRLPPAARVAVAGLGAGSLAALAAPGHSLVFHEIDPAVTELARDPECFSFLARSKARCDVVQGDATVTLAEAPERVHDLVVIDAFFGGAVVSDFFDARVVARFAATLVDDGLLAYHITSTSLGVDHRPELARAAGPLAGAWKEGTSPELLRDPTLEIDPEYDITQPVASRWAVLSRDHGVIARMVDDRGWSRLE